MFTFSEPTNTVIEPVVLQQWDNYTDFTHYLAKQGLLKMDGWGQLHNYQPLERPDTGETNYLEEVYHLFNFNDKLYASLIAQKDDAQYKKHFVFQGVFELDINLLKQHNFRNAANKTHYQKFEVPLDIDCKLYDYSHEQKLLVSKQNKIDLYYSQELIMNPGNHQLKSKVFPSIEAAIKWQKMMDLLNVRCEEVIAKKQAKKSS